MDSNDYKSNDYKDLEKDPNTNPFYYWGLIFFVSGLLNLTIMPLLIHSFFIYPESYLFTIPSAILLLLSFIFWWFAVETEIYQAVVIGYGLLLYGLFQILLDFLKYGELGFSIYVLISVLGLILILSAYNIFENKTRKKINIPLLFISSLFSVILAFLVLYFALIFA